MAFFSSKKDIVSKKNPSHRQVFPSPILTSLFYLKSLLMDQKDPIWTCVSRLKECAFVLSSSALDYGKRPFTINSFCAVQYRLSRKKKKRKKFCKPSMQLTEESVALPKFPFVFFRLLGTQTLGPNLYATLLYIQIFSLHPLSRGKYDEFFA